MLKRILVGLGGTDYTISAIRQAVALAQVHDAEVTGVSVLDETRLRWTGPVPLGGSHFAHRLAEERIERARERSDSVVEEFQTVCRESSVRRSAPLALLDGSPPALMVSEPRIRDSSQRSREANG